MENIQKKIFFFMKLDFFWIFWPADLETVTESPIIEENLTNVKEEAFEEVEILDEDIANSFVVQIDQVTSNDDTLSKNEIVQDNFFNEEEEYKEENGRNSALDPLDSENTETYRSKSKREHKCNTCPKYLSTAESLKRHIYTVHEGHKDFKCDSCGKSFTLDRNLKRHIKNIHWNCKHQKSICSKLFLYWLSNFFSEIKYTNQPQSLP